MFQTVRIKYTTIRMFQTVRIKYTTIRMFRTVRIKYTTIRIFQTVRSTMKLIFLALLPLVMCAPEKRFLTDILGAAASLCKYMLSLTLLHLGKFMRYRRFYIMCRFTNNRTQIQDIYYFQLTYKL